jgi:hypothetical protein
MSRRITLLAVILVLETALIAQQSATPAQNPPAGRGDAATPPIAQGGQRRRGNTASVAAGEECPAGMTLVREMDALNLRVLVINSASGQRLTNLLEVIRTAGYADRFRVMADVDFRNVGPGWATKAVTQLEADIQAGAVGIGEIGKQLGLSLRKADGSRLHIDDPT